MVIFDETGFLPQIAPAAAGRRGDVCAHLHGQRRHEPLHHAVLQAAGPLHRADRRHLRHRAAGYAAAADRVGPPGRPHQPQGRADPGACGLGRLRVALPVRRFLPIYSDGGGAVCGVQHGGAAHERRDGAGVLLQPGLSLRAHPHVRHHRLFADAHCAGLAVLGAPGLYVHRLCAAVRAGRGHGAALPVAKAGAAGLRTAGKGRPRPASARPGDPLSAHRQFLPLRRHGRVHLPIAVRQQPGL